MKEAGGKKAPSLQKSEINHLINYMTSPQKPGKQEKNGVKYFKHWERKHTHTHTQPRIPYSVELSFKSEREIK